MLERALDIVNKWPRDIGDRWRQNLIEDVVSVVVTVVIVNTVKPLPLTNLLLVFNLEAFKKAEVVIAQSHAARVYMRMREGSRRCCYICK